MPATPTVWVNAIISSSIWLSSQAVVDLVFIFENIKAVELASTLKIAIIISIGSALSRTMGNIKKEVKETIMRSAKYCK